MDISEIVKQDITKPNKEQERNMYLAINSTINYLEQVDNPFRSYQNTQKQD